MSVYRGMKHQWPALALAAGLFTTSACNLGGNPLATTDVLLYNGTGVSTSDWQTTESLIQSQGWSYELIVIPGGIGGTITSYLTPETRLNLRQAVQDQGVGYVGFCAGAWIAVGPEAQSSATATYGLAIAPGHEPHHAPMALQKIYALILLAHSSLDGIPTCRPRPSFRLVDGQTPPAVD